MANDNETVAEVCDELREHDLVPPPRGAWVIYADRMLAAHKREIAAAGDARRLITRNYTDVIAAKERIIAAKDAMIAEQASVNESQASQLRDALNEIAAKDAEIAGLRQLLKELADALYEGARIGRDHPMYAGCVEFPEWGKSVSVLVSKAREACHV